MCVLIRNFFRPRQDRFLCLLEEQAAKTLEGLEALQTYMNAQGAEAAQRVARAEKEADELRRILIDELNRTFITPIDREDIFSLSRAIDDIVDYAYSTVDEMQILNLEPNDYLRRMVSLLRDAGGEILLAMQRLKKHPGVAMEHATRAKALENRVESVYREAIAWLFQQPTDLEHIVKMLKLREIFRHLSNAADRGDEAANIIGDIVVKMT
jgi:predicted phosphate transport protein (TIGR00153 family)